MVNNFEQIKHYLTFTYSEDFYFIQVIRRKKDNPDMTKSEKVIRDYFYSSGDDYEKMMKSIIEVCDNNNARAYIHLNNRNYKKVAHKMNIQLGKILESGNHRSIKKLFRSACGTYSSDTFKKWLVDVDVKDLLVLSMIKHDIVEKCAHPHNKPKIIDTIETKNGFHIIATPFDIKKLKSLHNDLDVHKNNGTILYCA